MNPLELLEDPLRALLDFLAGPVGLTYGWAIVALTVIVRLILLPLFLKQYKSMKRMQAYAPQLKEIQRRNKGNRQQLNEEMMAFYKDNQINPFASCLPLLAQLPIFIALYYVLRNFSNDAEARAGEVLSFMWVIPDISKKLTEIGWGAGVVVAIYATSQLLSTELSATPNMSVAQRRMMRALPIVIVFFVFQFPVPAGLVLYWMTTNLWTCGQQLVMKRRIGENPVLSEEELAKIGKATNRSSRTPPKTAETEAPAPAPARPVKPARAKGSSPARDTTAGNGSGGRKQPSRTPVTLDKGGREPGGNGSDPAGRSRKRRRPAPLGGAPPEDGLRDVPEPRDAPEPADAAEAREAPEPADSPAGGGTPNGSDTSGGRDAPKSGSGSASSGKRRPRPGSQNPQSQGSRSSRPAAPAKRRAPKKRR